MERKQLDRLVIDTNIIVSLALGSKFQEIIELKAFYRIQIYTCEKQISELERTFTKVADKLNEAPEYYTKIFGQFATITDIDERFDRSPDAKDNFLFDLDYKVKSYYLVTGEKALLNMKQVNQIKIISIIEIRKILNV